jgi:hypothetical protein
MLVFAPICSMAEPHGDDPEQVFKDLRAMVIDVVESYTAEGKPLPEPRELVAA